MPIHHILLKFKKSTMQYLLCNTNNKLYNLVHLLEVLKSSLSCRPNSQSFHNIDCKYPINQYFHKYDKVSASFLETTVL